MSFVEHIISSKLDEAREALFARLDEIVSEKLEAAKAFVVDAMFEEVEWKDDDQLDEATKKRNPNIQKMGRVLKIRRRIRRNKKGRIIVQRNVRKSGIKGYRLSGSTVRKIPATVRIAKARKLKRSWKTTRRAKLRRTLFKRKMSMRRRASIGLK
jgi:predicted GNAT family N-acyltransferase